MDAGRPQRTAPRRISNRCSAATLHQSLRILSQPFVLSQMGQTAQPITGSDGMTERIALAASNPLSSEKSFFLRLDHPIWSIEASGHEPDSYEYTESPQLNQTEASNRFSCRRSIQ